MSDSAMRESTLKEYVERLSEYSFARKEYNALVKESNQQKILILVDTEDEMLSIQVDDQSIFYGNFWDFNRPQDIIKLLQNINGLNLKVGFKKIEV